MNRVVHFELPVEDPERSISFFGEIFGWKFHKWDGPMDYWLVSTGEGVGIDGGMMRRNPGQPITTTIDVENLDSILQRVGEKGGEVVVPKMAVPGVGWLAYFKDPDGNIHGAMQADHSAA